jgi:hypothetical protein
MVMAHIIQLKGGTAEKAALVNEVLHDREIGVETDTLLFKMGDGVTPWNDLDYGGLKGSPGIPGPSFLDGGTFSTTYVPDQYIDGGPF